jgi:hypothetical protein
MFFCLFNGVILYSPIQSYQLGEELARAFTERTTLQVFLEAESSVHQSSLKVHL